MGRGPRRGRVACVALLAAVLGLLTTAGAAQAQQRCFLIVFCAPAPPPPPPPTQCSDGVDNDKDGFTDLADAGCPVWSDVSEYDDPAPDANGKPRGPDVDPATSGKLFGFNTHLGLWQSGVTSAQEADLIRKAGGFAQRIPVRWSHVQPTAAAPVPDRLAVLDRSYVALAARGMYPMLVVTDAPVWASYAASCSSSDAACLETRRNPPANLPPANVGAFANFMAFLARRYPGAILEPWNEPNVERFWHDPSFPNPGRVASMQCAAYDAIKQARPSTPVASAGFAFIGSGPSAGQVPYVDFVPGVHQNMRRRCWDGLSVHVYASSNVDGVGSSTAFAFRAIRAVRQRVGDSTPIWVTETGSSTTGSPDGDHGHTRRTPEEQKRIVRLMLNELLTTSDVQMVLLHTLRDRATMDGDGATAAGPQYGFGALYDLGNGAVQAKPLWCHLMHVRASGFPGCAAGESTLPPPTG